MRVLVIEDNHDLAANIGDHLEARGHEVDFALDGVVGLHLAVSELFDVIVLDLTLPGMDGLTVCRRLREDGSSDVPVLMLTARDTLPDKLEGFEAGADDYLIKPFALQELSARIEALARRGRQSRPETLRVADLELHIGRFEAFRGGTRLDLNPTGFRILRLLLEASPRVVRRSDLERELWGHSPPDSDALRSHIYALRRAVDRGFDRPLLHTVHGVGYRLDPGGTTTG
jgi:DNA-binding response OmpR family regulator